MSARCRALPAFLPQRSISFTLAACAGTSDPTKERHIYPISDDLIGRPGPRLAGGPMAIARLIQPEIFP